MKSKIVRRLTLYFAVVLLLFALISGVLFSLMFSRHTVDVAARDLRAHAESIADTLSHFVANYLEGSCQGSGFKSYTRFVGDLVMSDLYLIDAQGVPVTIGELKTPTSPLPHEADALVSRIFDTKEIISESVSGGILHPVCLMAGAPILTSQDNVLYALILHYPVNTVEHSLLDTIYILSACLCISMVLSIAVSDFLSHRFVTPLHRMMEATTKLTCGSYNAKTGVNQNDEIGVLATHIDTLALKLDAAEKERNQLDQMRQDFFSDISHELRTPISVLKGSMELLCEGMVQDPIKVQEYYQQLYADIHHLERLVNDLLELTRLQNTQFKIEMEPLNLIDVLEESIRSMRQRATPKHISIRFDNSIGPFPVLGDYVRLRQLITILLDNAIKFSPDQTEISIVAMQVDCGCKVSIIDHGIGIDDQALEHIFSRYFHNTTSLNRTGTGLGLPIAKEIALRHQLDLTCESKLGEGTCFSLVFPECRLFETSI